MRLQSSLMVLISMGALKLSEPLEFDRVQFKPGPCDTMVTVYAVAAPEVLTSGRVVPNRNEPPPVPVAAPSRVIVALPFAQPTKALPDAERLVPRPVPSVIGLDLRQATRTLHAAGFHVTVVAGEPGRTRPAAGVLALPGTLIALEMAK